MRRFAWISLVVVICGLAVFGCAKKVEPIRTYNDPAQPITVNVGQQFVIYLPYNPDTGYTWREQYDSAKLELVQSICFVCQAGQEQFLATQGYGLANIPQSAQVSQFRAQSKGETMVTMVYENSPSAQPVETQVFTIIIQ